MLKRYKGTFAALLLSLLFTSTAFADDIAKHMLTPDEFAARINSPFVEILDLRKAGEGIMVFPLNRVEASLENKQALDAFLDKYKQSGETVLVIDQDGSKLAAAQKAIEAKGIKNYFFMKGGVVGYQKAKAAK